jgi:hypothetical protein
MWAGGSGDISPFSENQYIPANTGRAFPSAEEITVCMKARLSAFTMIVKSVEGSSAAAYSVWGKEVRNNSAILRERDGFSQFMMVTRNTLGGIEFMEAWSSQRLQNGKPALRKRVQESSMTCCRVICRAAIKNDSSKDHSTTL